MLRKLVSIALAACLFAFGSRASAQYAPQYTPQYAPPPPPPPGYGAPSYASSAGPSSAGGSIGGLLGFGVCTVAGCGADFGFGAEGGYTLPMHLFIGGVLDYHAGGFGVFIFQPEVGYDIPIGQKMMIRPFAGLGYADAIVSTGCGAVVDGVCVGAGSAGFGAFALTPGAMFAYFVTPHVYVGGELRINILFDSVSSGALLDFFGTGGYKF